MLNVNEVLMSNNYGPFRIINDNSGKDATGHRKAIIKFENTGYETEVLLSNIHKGNVKDDTIQPLRDLSSFTQEQHDKFINYKILGTWHDILDRCYNQNHKEYYAYGEIGVKMSDAWVASYNTFYNDCHTLFQFNLFYNNPYLYQLDKDYLQLNIPKSNRIYSKETCVFLSNRDNMNLRAIENKMTGNTTSKYYGVAFIKNKYYMGITNNGYKISMYFSNEIAAANAYNYWFEKMHLYDLVPLHNEVPYMPVEEWTKYRISKRPMFDEIV